MTYKENKTLSFFSYKKKKTYNVTAALLMNILFLFSINIILCLCKKKQYLPPTQIMLSPIFSLDFQPFSASVQKLIKYLNTYSYISNRISVCVCVSVPQDLASRCTNMVLLYTVESQGPRKVYKYFGEGYHHNPKKITSRKKTSPPQVPLEAFISVATSII